MRQFAILVYNPEEAKRDRTSRDRILARIEKSLAALGDQKGKAHKKSVLALLSHRTMGRCLRQLKDGALCIDRGKIRQEAHLDGKYILSTSDDTLNPEDIALGYKQLLEVERASLTLKTTLYLRPIYHRKDDRIEAHVFLCFLTLLLVRIAKRKTGITWDRIRGTMERLHLIEFFSKDGRVLQTTEPTPDQLTILKKLKISPPKRVQDIQTNS